MFNVLPGTHLKNSVCGGVGKSSLECFALAGRASLLSLLLHALSLGENSHGVQDVSLPVLYVSLGDM